MVAVKSFLLDVICHERRFSDIHSSTITKVGLQETSNTTTIFESFTKRPSTGESSSFENFGIPVHNDGDILMLTASMVELIQT